MEKTLICRFSDLCSGCTSWGQSPSDQARAKRAGVLSAFAEAGLRPPVNVETAALPDRGLRDRLDFQIRADRKGLWDRERHDILDLPECLQLSPVLQDWLSEFRGLNLNVRKGSFRLRVSPDGRRGVWLDLENEDVKNLFEEKRTLRVLSEMAAVEIGQRRKALVFQNDEPKLLKEPVYGQWTRTWVGGEAFALSSRIADFSQVGDVANRVLVESFSSLLPRGHRAVEFGSGNGNLTFPLLSHFESVDAFESDASVCGGLRESFARFVLAYPEKKSALRLHEGDFQARSVDLKGIDTAVVNPPRSGIGNFLRDLDSSPVQNLIYMSCYPESMAKDMRAFPNWSCQKLILVDQFPQTAHVEALSLWVRG